jgi:glycosyltransferase involved in cell wall biosynthesis
LRARSERIKRPIRFLDVSREEDPATAADSNRAPMRSLESGAMRILHAPSNLANQAWASAQGLRALGHEAEVWHYGPNPYDFPADRVFETENKPDRVIAAFREALERDFDVFHFHFARSLVSPVGGLPWFWDLPVLRALGKRIVFTFHGSDVRKKSVHLAEDPWSYYRFSDVESNEERVDKALDVIRTYAQVLIVASPINRTFGPEAEYIPKAIELSAFPYAGPRRETKPLVVHAPSKRATKGSDFVIRGVEELRRRGADFDFRIVENVPHVELQRIYADADLVVDNLLLGDAEVSAIEAMALGKPVVTRIRDEVRTAHPDLPVVNADPDSFVESLTPLLKDPGERRRLGEQARAFVERTHAAEVVAAQLIPLYDIEPHPVWRVFPEWTGLSSDRKLEDNEARIRGLETKIKTLQRRLRDRESVVQDVRALYGDSKPVKILRELRRRRKKKG